jgi:MFS family permease
MPVDGSIVNVALPTLEESLHTHFSMVQWVVVAYLLVITSLMLGVARLADMIGKKRIFLTGMAVFTVGSALCGMAPGVGWLIAFRVLQGVGAVMIMALTFAIVTEAFPPSERGRALGLMGPIVSRGISVGPTRGGADRIAAGAIFVNLPVGSRADLVALRARLAAPAARFDSRGRHPFSPAGAGADVWAGYRLGQLLDPGAAGRRGGRVHHFLDRGSAHRPADG